jgi:hypothetical protein
MCMNECKKAFERVFRKSMGLSRFFPLVLIALLVTTTGARAQHPNHPLCQKIANHQLQASAGAQMYCFGPQANGPARPSFKLPSPGSSTPGKGSGDTFGTTNVDAGNRLEDQNNGTQSYGQSETSVAAAGPYVVEAWNDATGFFAPCGSPNNKEELTGFAFSSDGGNTFTDMGGLPNADCANFLYEGDPSVEVYQVGGNTYFYISSIFIPLTIPANDIAMTACQVVPGSPAILSCGQPIIVATSSECETIFTFTVCSFLDKDFLSIDPVHGKLYVTYTDFGFVTHPDDIDLAVCDLSNPAAPVCHNGSGAAPQPAYLTLASSSVCEIEGAYPAVDPATGDVYVGHESNWFTNQFAPCNSVPVQDVVHYVPASCLTLPTASCSGPATTATVNIVSTDTTLIAGYNRGTGNDFPRLAVSDVNATVSMVWNDTRSNPLADILLQSFDLVSLAQVQTAPVKLNNDSANGTLHFLPALRNADANGNLNVSWYDRRLSPSSALTDVFAALGVNPRTTGTPKSNTRVTNVSSNWLVVSSDITPNFGDYTDNYIAGASGKALASRIFAAWSDGRINDPQPFCAHQGLK